MFSGYTVYVHNKSLYTLGFIQLPSLGKHRKCAAVGKKRITEREGCDGALSSIHRPALCYDGNGVIVASASWRSGPFPSVPNLSSCTSNRRRNDRKLRQRRRRRRRRLANHVTNPLRLTRSLPLRLEFPAVAIVGEAETVVLAITLSLNFVP